MTGQGHGQGQGQGEGVKLWGGRFAAEGGRGAEPFTASIGFDRRLFRQDIAGSIAHARMLARVGVLTQDEAAQIVAGLDEIRGEIERGEFPFRVEYEDIHLNIERRLIEKIGPVGGKLHTARSRNDQVALDMHLYMKEEIAAIMGLVAALQRVLVHDAANHLEARTVIPGYTHLQRAQPVLLAHHLMAYFWMLERDHGRLADCLRRADAMPLGAAALAGTSHPIDRQAVADELGFAALYENSMDAVSDRDYLIEFLAAASVLMMHLSRFCEEVILWNTHEFGFVELDDAYATGSSIMPQKKNPDVAELVRGKTGRVYGHLMGLLTVMKGLPLAYHTDMQEDKEAVFDVVDTLRAVLPPFTGMVATMRVRADRVLAAVGRDFANATDLADYLVGKGIPFREAHAVVGRAVRYCVDRGKSLEDLTLDELRQFSDAFDAGALAVLPPEAVVAARRSAGGTAPERVREQIERARGLLAGKESAGKQEGETSR